MSDPRFEAPAPLDPPIIFTPLGIRFWDAALDAPITDGLTVTAREPDSRGKVTLAVRTLSGVYAFHGLAGMHAIEYPAGSAAGASAPPTPFIIEVVDTLGRYLPTAFRAPVPYAGIFPTQTVASALGEPPPGVILFSAPTRVVRPTLAVIRAELRDAAAAFRPAAYAVLDAHVGPRRWTGVADAQGRVMIVLPYPTFSAPAGTSLIPSAGAGAAQRWPVTLSVRYGPAELSPIAGGQAPDLKSILSQSPGVIWQSLPSLPGAPAGELATELVFGQELVVRTDDESALLISPAVSPL